jgi:carboxylate-amine ligase
MIGRLAARAAALLRRRRTPDPLPTERSPDWPAGAPLTVEACVDVFEQVAPATVGVEEELFLVSPETLELVPREPGLVAALGRDVFRGELRASQLEIVTPVCESAAEVGAELERARLALAAAAGGRFLPLAAGTHPFATDWGEVSEADRYRMIEDEYSWAARRSLACGLHVHVAVGGADRSLAVFNALRSYLPEISALAANSPFLEGEDTGLSSVRPKLIGSLPRTGVPPALGSWVRFVAFLDWARAGGLFPDASFLWWDLRPHPGHGTIELRAADSQTRVEDSAAIAALVHCLAVWLAERWSAGERLAQHDSARIEENVWRALRYGIAGELVDLDTGRREATRARIARLVDALEPTAASLGCEDELLGVRVLLAGNGAERQRRVAARDGLHGLTRWLTGESVPEPAYALAAGAGARRAQDE